MNCPYCNNQIPPNVSNCPNCGAALQTQQQYQQYQQYQQPQYQQQYQQPQYQQQYQQQPYQQPMYQQPGGYMMPPKSRTAYILLGIFLGGFGIHNFYAGYHGRGIAQLLISLFTCALGGLMWIWIIIEICTVDVDANGNPMV